MEAPIDKPRVAPKPRLPARSVREIRRRRLGKRYQSPMSRLFYALLNGLLYGFGGLIIDLAIVVIRSIMDIGSGDIFWLFTPFMALLGAIIGFIVGKNAGAESADALTSDDSEGYHPSDHDFSMRHDIIRGLFVGISIFAIIWLIMMLVV